MSQPISVQDKNIFNKFQIFWDFFLVEVILYKKSFVYLHPKELSK